MKKRATTRALAKRPARATLARTKTPRKTPTTALVPAAPAAPLTPATPDVAMVLRDEAYLANFGTETVALTEAQETILAEPINAALVEVLPTGSVYLPHTEYAKWLDRAFGRTGWVLRPMANPRRIEEQKRDGKPRVFLQQPFMLYLKGVPAAWAYGGAEYHEDNRDQNYDDVIESLQSFALRRVCKHLRLGAELWDKRWVRAWLERNAVKVSVEGSTRPQWRRASDPKLYRERGLWREDRPGDRTAQADASGADDQPARSYGRSTSPEPISEPQLRRLIAIAKRHGVTDVALKDWLAVNLPYTQGPDRRVSKKAIRRCDYDAVVDAVEGGLRASTPAAPPTASDPLVGEVISAADIDWDGYERDDRR